MTQEILVAFGSNLQSQKLDQADSVMHAIVDLHQCGLTVRRVSRLFQTPCFPAGAGPDYVNACVAFDTTLTPKQVLNLLHDVEARHGRTRAKRWAARTLDLDLIAFGSKILPNTETHQHWRDLPEEAQAHTMPEHLILPHPRLQDRAFVLVPLNDIAPSWRHPILGRSVAEMTAGLSDAERAEIVAL